MVTVSEMDLEWSKSHLTRTFDAWSARVWLHWPANGRRGRGKGCIWGRRDGGQVMGTDTTAQGMCKCIDVHTQLFHVIHPTNEASLLFRTVLYLLSLAPLYVCDVWLWSLGISAQTNTSKWILCGKAGWSKGNPLFKEGFTVFISSWTTVDVLEIMYKLKVNIEKFKST